MHDGTGSGSPTCLGLIEKIKISNSEDGQATPITVITIDSLGWELYTDDITLRDPLAAAFYKQSLIQVYSYHKCAPSSKFDTFTIFQVY